MINERLRLEIEEWKYNDSENSNFPI